MGGHPAKHVALTVRENVGCDPGFFYAWRGPGVHVGALWPTTGVGDTIRVWIVDVDGTRLFIEAETKPTTPPAKSTASSSERRPRASRNLEQEVQQIVESLRFE